MADDFSCTFYFELEFKKTSRKEKENDTKQQRRIDFNKMSIRILFADIFSL